ncbi:EamA family transporter RarD [Bacillus sp. T33-2]|uniref:EamA family transporter RarD n=1 Tax=Bacillus sp. T33-2 TaxID=2054168 RepID=UPI000C793853|nr:EamA family transporter RarD [Bacillus sp. T33-2]
MKTGIFYAAFSYILWGVLPIYWKLLGGVGSDEILANRVFWSFFFMVALLLVTKKRPLFIETFRGLAANRRQMLALITASILISINWFIYIYAVNTGQMIQASLGYYINPLVSVLLGMIFLKEKLSVWQYLSFGMAAIGVLILTFSYGQFPWIALTLAISFGLYGLAKKLIKVEAAVGLTLETLVVMPVAAVYMAVLFLNGTSTLFNSAVVVDILLIGAGAATAVPLLYFARGAQSIPLSMLGFLQYIAPTITLLLGVFMYDETFSKVHLLSFTFIWAAVTIYSVSRTKLALNFKTRKGKGIEL